MHVAQSPFDLEEKRFLGLPQDFSSKGRAAGPSEFDADADQSTTAVLDSHVHSGINASLQMLGEQLSRAETPPVIVDVIRLGDESPLSRNPAWRT